MNYPVCKSDIGLSRDSNIELLRLVCMFFIVCHHFCVHAVFPETLDSDVPLSQGVVLSTIIEGFLFIGVNCFVLISGYYGVKLKKKSLLNLWLTCAVYGLVIYLVHLRLDCATVGKGLIYNSLLVFSHGSWWYIQAYLILLLLSPILNEAIEHLGKEKHQYVIAMLLIMQIYFGNFWQCLLFDTTGYNALNFVLLYFVGQYIKRYVPINKINDCRWTSLGLYVGFALCWGGLTIFDHVHPMSFWYGFTYNNVFTLASSICFFCFMLSFHFYSKSVNWLAVSTLAVYLLQDSGYSSQYIYPLEAKYCGIIGSGLAAKWLYIFVTSMVFFFSILFIDKVRYYLFSWFFKLPHVKRIIE